MSTVNLLYKREIPINDDIKVVIPKVGEILENEENYYSTVATITAMPIDFMVQLDDIGVDFTTLNAWDLFLMMFGIIQKHDTELVFGDLDLTKFEMALNESNQTVVLADPATGVVIDRAIHAQIADTLRKIHHFKKDVRKPADAQVQQYLIERARKKMKRNKNRQNESELEKLIVAMVNTEQYKYDFEGTRELSIYQFNESVRQIIHKVDYDNRMFGVYTGNINAKELSDADINWLTHK